MRKLMAELAAYGDIYLQDMVYRVLLSPWFNKAGTCKIWVNPQRLL